MVAAEYAESDQPTAGSSKAGLKLERPFESRRPGDNRGTEGIEASIGASLNAALYLAEEDDEPDPLTVAAHLGFYLCRGHSFADGNKRVGWYATVDQLAVFGLDIEASQDDAAAVMESVSANTTTVSEFQIWIADRLVVLPSPPFQ